MQSKYLYANPQSQLIQEKHQTYDFAYKPMAFGGYLILIKVKRLRGTLEKPFNYQHQSHIYSIL